MSSNLLRSGEGVSLSGNPVDVVVVKAPREAAGGTATDLGISIQLKISQNTNVTKTGLVQI